MKIKTIKSTALLSAALAVGIGCSDKTISTEENERTPENRVIYEVFVRNFSPEGNLKGVESQIPRLKDLGVDVVWLMPIYMNLAIRAGGDRIRARMPSRTIRR